MLFGPQKIINEELLNFNIYLIYFYQIQKLKTNIL